MSEQILTIEELKDVTFEEFIRQILAQRNRLSIVVSDDEELSIELKPRLKPLPVLDGSIAEGWKEAIYD